MPVKKKNKTVSKKPNTKVKKSVPAKKPKAKVAKTKQSAVKKETIYCSFCGKNAEDLRRLLAGPNNVNICNECIDISVRILGEDAGGYYCPVFSLNASRLISNLGSELSKAPDQRTRVKYEILYLAPVNPLSEKIYSTHILPTAEKQKLKIKHISEVLNSKLSFNKELLDIYNASLVIADIQGQNPDIMYFLGMINLIGKPLIILAQKPEDLPKGLEGDKLILYKNSEKSLYDIAAQIQPVFHAIKKIKRLTKGIRKKP